MTRNRRTLVARLLAPVGNVVVATFVLLAVVAALLMPRTRPVTDLGEYDRLLAQWSSTGLTARFPSSVPARVGQARLSCLPGVWQGGGHLQLCTLVSPEDAAAADAKYASLATYTFRVGDTNDQANQPNDTRTVVFHTSGTNVREFDPSFNIYVLSPQGTQAVAPRNHGKCCGVAVSTKHNEVVYWAESW